jgi:succinoglycan biosynthesis transport protein ExoP
MDRNHEDNQLIASQAGGLPTMPTMPAMPLHTITVGGSMGRDASHLSMLQTIWRRRLIVLVTLLLAAIGSYVYIQTATPIYESSSRLYVQPSNPKIMGPEDPGTVKANLNTECSLIRSGPILAEAIESPGIKTLRTFSDKPSPVGELARGLTVTAGKDDDTINIAFETPYAEDAQQIVNAVVSSYIGSQSTRRKNTASEVLKILQKEKVRRDGDLEENLKAMLDFKQLHPELGFQGDKGNIIVQRLERLSTALTEAELEVVEAKGLMEAVTAMKDDPAKIRQFFENKRAGGGVYVNTQDNEDTKLQSEISNLELRLRDVKRRYTATTPAELDIKAQIESIRQQLAQREAAVAGRHLAAVGQQYDSAVLKLKQIQDAYKSQIDQAQGLNKVAADFAKIQSNYEQTRKMVDGIDSRIKELNVTEDVGAMNITIMDPASRPDRPVKPNKAKLMALCLAAGLLLGVGLAMLREMINPRLTKPEQISSVLGVPVVGVLPLLKGKNDVKNRGQTILLSPVSQSSEAYRSIRTAITFGAPGGVRSILITSPAPGEGKSTLVSNLGIAMAQAGQKILIIDADFRQPQQHNIFGLANEVGLSNLLNNGEDFQPYIVKSGAVEGLDVITTGKAPQHPSELLNNVKFVQMMRKLSAQYDLILLDSPPVMVVTDSLVLAALSDMTMLVVRSDKTYRRMAEETRESLAGVGARIFGAVVNAVPAKKGRYPSRYYYGNAQSASASTEIVKTPQL